MLVYWILFGIGCFLFLTIVIVFSLVHRAECRRIRDELAQVKAKRDKFEALANLYEEQNKELHEKLLQKENDAGFAQGQQVQGELQARDVAAELNSLKEQKELEALRVSGLALTSYEFLQALARSKEVQLQVENVTHGLENRNRELCKDIDSLQTQKSNVNVELQRMLCITKIIEEDKDHVVWDPILTEKQVKLIGILRDLISMYPDLTIDFATIEWKKIWMPQLQALGSIIDTKGIYRLVLRDGLAAPLHILRDGQEEELPVCYIGQAVSIKDRWYQHVKKMIGVMPTGNEKVYEWRPENFKWCIIEQGKDIDLDYSEKYWIQYYCAKDGLNKKL